MTEIIFISFLIIATDVSSQLVSIPNTIIINTLVYLLKIFYATKINRFDFMIRPFKNIIVGSRESPLAKEQVEIFLRAFKFKFGFSKLKLIKKIS